MKSKPFFQKHTACFDSKLHSSYLCDQLTLHIIHPSTNEALFLIIWMVKALVDSTACMSGSRPGPVACVIQEKKKKNIL